MVAGITLLSDIHARTLFDTGASYSFISCIFARTHGFEERPLGRTMFVQTPGPPMEANCYVPSCPVRLGWLLCPWDLVVIPIRELDVVLGMDWLTNDHAVIDCEKHQVRLHEPGFPEHVYLACKSTFFSTFIFASRARRLLKVGCVAYMASVDIVSWPSTTLSDVPIVRDFLDIFSEELPGLPPKREIEFSVELISGTQPITKALYWMAFAELKELKAQLEDLLDRGCIRPSVSPWGAPVLFMRK